MANNSLVRDPVTPNDGVRRVSAILGTALFLVIAPGSVAGILPWWISRWRMQVPVSNFPPLRVVGGLFIAAGLLGLLDSFARFALKGLGTPAPVSPTRHLVLTGLYRHVRNPMYLSVVALILGQALLFGEVRLLAYGLTVWFIVHLFVKFYEEPTLRATFGTEYAVFCAHVPRWRPRLSPWKGPDGGR